MYIKGIDKRYITTYFEKVRPSRELQCNHPSSPFSLCEAECSAGHYFIGFFLLFSFFLYSWDFRTTKTLSRHTCVKYFFFLRLFAFSILWAFCLQPPSALHLRTLGYTALNTLHYTMLRWTVSFKLAFTVTRSALASFFRWTGEKRKKHNAHAHSEMKIHKRTLLVFTARWAEL